MPERPWEDPAAWPEGDADADPLEADAEPRAPDPVAEDDRVREVLAALRRPAPGPRERVIELLEGWRAAPAVPLAGLGVVAVAVVVALVALRPAAPAAEEALPLAPLEPTVVAPTTTTAGPVLAHVAGAVATPGVYRLEPGARLVDLVAAAGGLTADADQDRLNLAAPVGDGSWVYVPRRGELELPTPLEGTAAAPPAGGAAPGDAGDGLVDVNTAGPAELETLPGIGPVLAAAIVEHRERNGPFGSVDELVEVSGIGDARLEQLRDRVRV